MDATGRHIIGRPTYTIGHDDALLPCEQVWWSKALDGLRYAAARVPMSTGRLITVFEIALALAMMTTKGTTE